jgi:hypothetical protein
MNHFNTIHQCWKNFLDRIWSSIVKRVNELFKSLKIFNIILSFVKSLSNSQLNASPFRCSQVNFVSWFAAQLILSVVWSRSKDFIYSSAVLASKLFRNTSELSHSLFPVVQLILWSAIFVLFLIIVSSFKCFLDLVTPFIKDFFKLWDHFLVWRPCSSLVFDLIVPFPVVLIESNVWLKTFQGFS